MPLAQKISIYSQKGELALRSIRAVFCAFKASSFSVLAIALMSSCHLLHTEPKADSNVIHLNEATCKSQIRDSLSHFSNGTATSGEVQTSLECVDRYIERFKSTTRTGAPDGSYGLEEVESFFRQFFGETVEFNTQSLKEYFRIKSLSIGGDESRITRAELSSLQALLKEAQPILSDMTQDVSILLFKAKLNLTDPADDAKLQRAIENVRRIEMVLRKYLLGGAGVQYKISNLNNIEILKPKHEKVLSETESLQLIMSLKSILVRPPEDSIRGEDFSHFISQLGLIAESGLRLKYTRDLTDWHGPVFVRQVQLIRQSAFTAISDAFQTQDHQRIANLEITQLISKLDRYQLLPFGLKEQSIQKFMPELMAKVLASNPAHKVGKETNLDFTPDHLNVILGAVDEWLHIQKSFIAALDGENEISAQDLIEKFDIKSKALVGSDLAMSANAMKEILANGVFLRWKDSDILNLAPRDLNQKFTSYDLVYLSTSFSIVRAVLRGYISDPARRVLRTLSESEMNDLYDSVRELGKDLKFVDTRNPLAPARAFLENNIFTSVSNGNNLVEFHEALEWVYQVTSAGRVGLKIYNQIPVQCRKQEVDVFDRQLLDHDCYSAYFKQHILEFFGHLPTVAKYLNNVLNHRVDPSVSQSSTAKKAAEEMTRAFDKASKNCKNQPQNSTNTQCSPAPVGQNSTSTAPNTQDPWTDFNISLENAYRVTGYSPYDYDSPDIEGMALILSYTESLFINHSRFHNDVLDSKDLWDTFPILKGFIEKASNGAANTEFIQKAAFSYLIAFGELPKVNTLWGKLKFGAWAAVRGLYQEKAYAPDILKVLSSFNEGGVSKKITDIESYFSQYTDSLQSSVVRKDSKTVSDLKALFFCLDDSDEHFGEILSENAPFIFEKSNNPLDVAQGTKFHLRIEELIRKNHELAIHCLPFE